MSNHGNRLPCYLRVIYRECLDYLISLERLASKRGRISGRRFFTFQVKKSHDQKISQPNSFSECIIDFCNVCFNAWGTYLLTLKAVILSSTSIFSSSFANKDLYLSCVQTSPSPIFSERRERLYTGKRVHSIINKMNDLASRVTAPFKKKTSNMCGTYLLLSTSCRHKALSTVPQTSLSGVPRL